MHRLVAGSLAGLAGTVAMDTVWYRRYRHSGGDVNPVRWEFALAPDTWEKAPAPARVAQLFATRVVGRAIPERHIALANDVMHWGYGTTMGVAYGLVLGGRLGVLRGGALWGASVWSSSYVTLGLAGIYEPIWKYDVRTLGRDLTAHLAFGLGTAACFALTREAACPES